MQLLIKKKHNDLENYYQLTAKFLNYFFIII
jgi:hypothetical protein